jgi:hypothetical protein
MTKETNTTSRLDRPIVIALIGLLGVIGAALIAVYRPTITNGPTPTPTPTVTPTPLPPPIGDNVVCESIGGAEICAWVSNGEPPQNSRVTVYGRLQIDGVPQVDMPMITKWHYESGPKLGEPPKTDIRGTASCERSIGPATVGYQVNVDVEIGNYKVTTWFTPQESQ